MSSNEEDMQGSDNEEELVNEELQKLARDDNGSQSINGSQNSIRSSRSTKSRSKSKVSQSQMSSRRGSVTSVRSVSNSVRSPMPQFLKDRLKVTFLYPLQKKYECPSCDEVLRYPVLLNECGHRCCSHCFETEIKRSQNPRCPVDQGKIDVDIACVDRDFNHEILALEVKCSNNEWGCKWEGEYNQIQDHLENCEYTEILCVNDCGAKFQKRFSQKHVEKDCPKKIISCAYCDDRHLREDTKEHLQECPKIPLPCPNKCDKTLNIPRDELDKHIEEACPKTKMNCEYENIGCEHRCGREKLAKHYKGDIINHVKFIYNLAIENKARAEKHDATLEEHVGLINEANKRVGALEQIAHNAMIWRIDHYTLKSKESMAKNSETLFSPTFTTSKHGYRLCASVCLNGDGKGKGTHVSVFINILKGAYDAMLKWPFDYRVTFVLLDQAPERENRKHLEYSMKPNPCQSNEPFLGRPMLEKNSSFGSARFAAKELVEEKYLKDDTLFIKIIVGCDANTEP